MAKPKDDERTCYMHLDDRTVIRLPRSPGFVFTMMAKRMGGEAHPLSNTTRAWCSDRALTHAVRFGFRFDIDDVEDLASLGKNSYRARGVYASENDYAIACGSERGLENRSFALSFEKWMGRKPFLMRDKDVKTPTRMYVGREFGWRGARVWCKSFRDGYFNAVEYDTHPGAYNPKVIARYKITHEDIKAYHAHLDGKEPRRKTR